MITKPQAQMAAKVTEFWSNVERHAKDGCWPWLGYVEDGYGRYYFDGRMMGAHELALTFWTGERRAPELDTCHSCNNPICCNPWHLRFDTRASNVTDAVQAGTHANMGRGKLSPEDVRTIRTRLANGAKGEDIAAHYKITNGMVSMIRTGKRYAHVR